jgi:hypothetical protein
MESMMRVFYVHDNVYTRIWVLGDRSLHEAGRSLLEAWLMDSGIMTGFWRTSKHVKSILSDPISLNQKLECKVSLGHQVAHISLSQVAFDLSQRFK